MKERTGINRSIDPEFKISRFDANTATALSASANDLIHSSVAPACQTRCPCTPPESWSMAIASRFVRICCGAAPLSYGHCRFRPHRRLGAGRPSIYFNSLIIASAALPAMTQLADPATTASSSNQRNPKSSMHSGKSGLMMMYPGITAPGM